MRFTKPDDPLYARIRRTILGDYAYDELFICPQVVFEARVVLTRPLADNGFGYSAQRFEETMANVLQAATLRRDPDDLVDMWLRICDRQRIVGKQCHDARFIAWMEAYGVDAILTSNPKHFAGFPGVQVLVP